MGNGVTQMPLLSFLTAFCSKKSRDISRHVMDPFVVRVREWASKIELKKRKR